MLKVIFVRVGWMRFYNGSVPGDERPVGGGRYNQDNIGHELYNFRVSNDHLYGYFQPSMASQKVNLQRIDPQAANAESLQNVLVVVVARRPSGGQVIVGWYGRATVFRNRVNRSPGKPIGYGHFCSAKRSESVLLPEDNRNHELPNGRGGLGMSNICYALDTHGQPKTAAWIQQAIDFIDKYQGNNILSTPEADVERESTEAVEKALARSQGQRFARDAAERKALEDLAMELAKTHFEKEGYRVKDVSANKPYDLLCCKNGQEIHVEVKGTTTDGNTVVLTRNEVIHAQDSGNKNVLFIVYSIKLNDNLATGKNFKIINPWNPQHDHLRPISYTYRLPEHED